MINAKTSYKQPNSLWWLSLCFALYMWTLGTLMASLTLYLQSMPPMDIATSYQLYATFISLLWILPVLGGYAAERTGYLRACYIGLGFCIVGCGLLSLQQHWLVYISLSLFLVGNALFTPALWCLVDHIYTKNDVKRESGFTLFYLLFNVSIVLGIFIGTNLGARYSYGLEFAVCTVFCVLSLAALHIIRHKLVIAPGRTIAPQIKKSNTTLNLGLCLAGVIATPLVWQLFLHSYANSLLTFVISVFSIIVLIVLATQQPTAIARKKIYGFLIMCVFATSFWTIYNIEPSYLSVYIKHFVNHTFLGITLAPDSFFGFEGAAIVIVGLLLSRLWIALAKRNKDINLAVKFGLGLILVALGCLYLWAVVHLHGLSTKAPATLIIVSYLLFATGELFIAPVGIAMVGKLSPPGKEGLLMGIWQLVMGLGGIFSGMIAASAVVRKHSSFALSNLHHLKLFLHLGLLVLAAGIVVLAISPWVKKLL